MTCTASWAAVVATIVAVACGIAGSPVAAATGTALSAQQLSRCAQRVATLRKQSSRLNQRASALNKQRQSLANRRAANEHPDNQQAPNSWLRYSADAVTFNKKMADFRQAVTQLNTIKQAYDRDCAGRPYSTHDLQTLPPQLQAALRAGLTGVQVPYLSNTPGPGATDSGSP